MKIFRESNTWKHVIKSYNPIELFIAYVDLKYSTNLSLLARFQLEGIKVQGDLEHYLAKALIKEGFYPIFKSTF